jgi:REP element-mobilizing transposase RayT
MGRMIRIEYPGALYHITSRGNERKNIFMDNSDRLKFLKYLEDYHERYGILIYCYVLMDNHYHLVLETPQGNLQKVMHGINGGYTIYFNRRHKRAGHLFQGRYKGILVDKENYLLELSRYVHLNPVRARIVKHPEEYEWSSFTGYLDQRKRLKWIQYSSILSIFGQDETTATQNYYEFVKKETPWSECNPLENLYGKAILGDKVFVNQIKTLLQDLPISGEITERNSFIEYINPDDLINAVAQEFRVSEGELRKKGGKNNTARKVAIYLVHKYTSLKNEEIGSIFGNVHYSTISKTSISIDEEMAHNEELARLVKGVISNFKT